MPTRMRRRVPSFVPDQTSKTVLLIDCSMTSRWVAVIWLGICPPAAPLTPELCALPSSVLMSSRNLPTSTCELTWIVGSPPMSSSPTFFGLFSQSSGLMPSDEKVGAFCLVESEDALE